MKSYERFYLLGMKYLYENVDLAFLCMEQSLFLCDDEEDRKALSDLRDELKKRPGFRVRPVSAVVVTFNDIELTRACLESFRDTAPEGSWEFIAVDNLSTDGVREWLRLQPDVKLLENDENAGFPVGCNIGFAAADRDSDILLINNDAVLAPNALFFLRMALYSSRDMGAVGAVSNNASEQCVGEDILKKDASLSDCLKFGEENNIIADRPLELRPRLTGFAVLLSRECADEVNRDGYLLDPRYSPGYFEDEDLGVRVALAGFKQALVHNAFVYHKGGTGFSGHSDALMTGRAKFKDKWGFDAWEYIAVLDDHEKALADIPRDRPLRILELNCGMGVNLAHLKYLYPYSTVEGIEADPVIAAIASRLTDKIYHDISEAPAGTYDIIFAWDAGEDDGLKDKLKKLLSNNGSLIPLATVFWSITGSGPTD